MTTQHEPRPDVHGHAEGSQHKRSGHSWMMIACCIPMLAIALILVATEAANPAFLFVAVGCTLMMALMMGGMDHGQGSASR